MKILKPVFNAIDEFLFGTDKVTIVPHIADHMDIKRYMSFVVLALVLRWLPRCIFGVSGRCC